MDSEFILPGIQAVQGLGRDAVAFDDWLFCPALRKIDSQLPFYTRHRPCEAISIRIAACCKVLSGPDDQQGWDNATDEVSKRTDTLG